MLFAVLLTDKPNHGSLRDEHLHAHIAWVDKNKERVLVAGSLRQEPKDVPRGGLWIVEAKSKAEVHEMMESDPFFVQGLRQHIEVLHWSKALPNHRALV